VTRIAPEKKENLDKALRQIYQEVRGKFKIFGRFQDVLVKSSNYSSGDLRDEQSPEEFVKRNIIGPLINLIGYMIVPETLLPSPSMHACICT
jgi:hypothetical protein